VRWSTASLTEALGNAAMLYLSIAHFGRGQGQWRHQEAPQVWALAVQGVLGQQRERLARLWSAQSTTPAVQPSPGECHAVVRDVLRDVLLRLYPDAGEVLPLGDDRADAMQVPDQRAVPGELPDTSATVTRR
jgi:hypothetical protein